MPVNTNILPAPDDLAGWKATENVLNRRISSRIRSANLVGSASLRQYFGCKDEDYLLDEYDQMSVMHGFIEWLVNDYRPAFRRKDEKKRKKKRKGRHKSRHKTRRLGRTLAERLLAEGIPAAEIKLLEACSQAHPSIFRIEAVDAGVSLIVEDILLGGQRIVHDKLLSGCVEAGQHLTGRVFPAGQFHFFSPIGPPLSNLLALEAAEYLESVGVEFTHEGLRREASKFGWLWNWYDRKLSEGCMPQIRNTDGDELVWQTASFSVSDERRAREILAKRGDIDYDDENDEYHWLRHQGKGATIPGDTLHLGRMQFLMDELIVDVNSAERLNTARQWLEEIDGVKYTSVKSRNIQQLHEEAPMDDRMAPTESVEMTPELVSSIKESFRQHYIDWLDHPLPILNGKTPRQACKTKAGRQKVAMLIRTIPQPMGNEGVEIDIPRQEMFRSLGIESEEDSGETTSLEHSGGTDTIRQTDNCMDDELREMMDDVAEAYIPRFIDLVTLTDAFCDAALNVEYKTLCREMAIAICQEDSPVLRSKLESWASGIVYALGRINFLGDPSQIPHMKSKEIAEGFGVSVATMRAKAKVIDNGLGLIPFHPDWSLPSKMDDNLLVWLHEVNGFLVDMRTAPREIQEIAYKDGLIPYIPADRGK